MIKMQVWAAAPLLFMFAGLSISLAISRFSTSTSLVSQVRRLTIGLGLVYNEQTCRGSIIMISLP